MRSSKSLAFACIALGGALAVLAAGRTWLRVSPLPSLSLFDQVVAVSGREAAPGAAALGLVALAGAVALVTSGPVVRRLVAVLLVLAGAGMAAATVAFLQDPGDAARAAVTRATGVAVSGSGGFTSTSTPWAGVCLAAAALVAAGGVVGVLRSGRWTGPSRRYETTAGGGAAPTGAASAVDEAASRRDRAYDAWDALSEGADPTDEGTQGPGRPAAGDGKDDARTS